MSANVSARPLRRPGWWRILVTIWTATILAGVVLIVAPQTLFPSQGAGQRVHFTPVRLPTFPASSTPQSHGGAQESVPHTHQVKPS
jgi:hypothetical protein